jgi:hypothetical protein
MRFSAVFYHQSKINIMKTIVILLSALTLLSCTTEPTLQKYFVEKSESADFLVTDIPASILKINASELTTDQAEALNSLEKLNILAFTASDEKIERFQNEKETLQKILKNPIYEELMRMGSGAGGATVYMKGTDDAVDEFIVFGHQKNSGFTVVRVLGNNMKPEQFGDFLGAIKNANLDIEGLAKYLP